MAEKTPATLAELKATFPNSTADWRESQLEAGASVSEAAIAYAGFVEKKAADEKAAMQKELEESKAKQTVKSGSLGHQPLKEAEGDGDYHSETGDAVEDFNAAVAKIVGPRADLARRQAAIRTVANRNPELYEAYLLATNPGKRQARLISEKLEAIGK